MPKEVQGVNTRPATREPRKMGRAEVVGSHSETIQPGKYAGGQDRMGTDTSNIHTTARMQGYADGKTHRAGLRDSTK